MLHQRAETFNQLSDVLCEINSFKGLFHGLHYRRRELDKVIADEADLILHSFNNRIYQ
jgi:hypothetical protein